MCQKFFIFCLLMLSSGLAASGELIAFKPGPSALDNYLGTGKWLVVKIWASDCVVCNSEAHQYVDFHEFHKDDDATVLGISLDGGNRTAAQSFIQRHDVNYPNLITDYTTGGRWFADLTGQRFAGTPGFLIYDPGGVLRAQQIGAVPTELIEKFIASNSTQ